MTMHLYSATEARSRENCWRRKAISITYSEDVFVAVLSSMQGAPFCICYIVVRGLFGFTKFSEIFVEHKICVLSNFF